MIRLADDAAIVPSLEMMLDFGDRADGDRDVVRKISVGAPPTSFGNSGGYRVRRPFELLCEQRLFTREALCHLLRAKRELMRLAPDTELSEVCHARNLCSLVSAAPVASLGCAQNAPTAAPHRWSLCSTASSGSLLTLQLEPAVSPRPRLSFKPTPKCSTCPIASNLSLPA